MKKMAIVIFSLLGAAFCVGGVLLIVFGGLEGTISWLACGISMYVGAMGILFGIRVSLIDKRVKELEKKIKGS